MDAIHYQFPLAVNFVGPRWFTGDDFGAGTRFSHAANSNLSPCDSQLARSADFYYGAEVGRWRRGPVSDVELKYCLADAPGPLGVG